MRCESNALYRVCQAGTTISSSFDAYAPTHAPKTGHTPVENSDGPLCMPLFREDLTWRTQSHDRLSWIQATPGWKIEQGALGAQMACQLWNPWIRGDVTVLKWRTCSRNRVHSRGDPTGPPREQTRGMAHYLASILMDLASRGYRPCRDWGGFEFRVDRTTAILHATTWDSTF